MSDLHVILGAGQIGPRIANELLARGHRVRMVRRSAFTAPSGIEALRADISNSSAAADAMRGARVVYHCANPLYTDWPKLLLPMTRGIVAGAASAKAHLVALDNLYMYGRAGLMREDTPIAPVAKKGELRAQAADIMLQARTRGDLEVSIGRASDFFGPDTPLAAIFGDRFWQRAFAGKAVEVLGDPDQPHSYSYVHDVAAGLVTLGTDARAKAHAVWHLPTQAAEPTRQTIARASQALGVDLRVTSVPTAVLRAMGLFAPMMREIAEMTYQWKAPFILDDSRFRSTFGQTPTAWTDAWRTTADWAVAAYAPASRHLLYRVMPGKPSGL